MNPIVNYLTTFQNIPSGYNPLSSSIKRSPLVITNFSNASSGYNVVVPSVDVANLSVYSIPGIDNLESNLRVGINTSTIIIGGSYSTTYIYSKVTEIDSQIIHIGLKTTTHLGNVSTSLANISVVNASVANVLQMNTPNISASKINASLANISLLNSYNMNVMNMTCYNLSAYSVRQCYALWYTTYSDQPQRTIGGVSLHTLQTSIIDNVSSLNESYGTFTCSYNGMYLCSIIVTPATTQGITMVYLQQNNNYIGPIVYGNTGNQSASLSGSLTLYCNARDVLSFYNNGVAIYAGNIDTLSATRAQMCSITLL